MERKLVFVYNADSGLFNLLGDAAHKLLSPGTYRCNLCALTHGHLGPRKEWTEFLRTLPIPTEFLHADELRDGYGLEGFELPAVFIEEGQGLSLLIDAKALEDYETVGELAERINSVLLANGVVGTL